MRSEWILDTATLLFPLPEANRALQLPFTLLTRNESFALPCVNYFERSIRAIETYVIL
jgi:hypothetical protein